MADINRTTTITLPQRLATKSAENQDDSAVMALG